MVSLGVHRNYIQSYTRHNMIHLVPLFNERPKLRKFDGPDAAHSDARFASMGPFQSWHRRPIMVELVIRAYQSFGLRLSCVRACCSAPSRLKPLGAVASSSPARPSGSHFAPSFHSYSSCSNSKELLLRGSGIILYKERVWGQTWRSGSSPALWGTWR